MNDPVNHPSHYTNGNIEVIDIIGDNFSLVDFCLGNVVKYVLRCQHKGKMVQDLKKARWYLNKVIDELDGGNDG